MKSQEAELKNHLMDLNHRQLAEYKARVANERDTDKQAGMMMASKAEEEAKQMRQIDLQKKQAYHDALNSEI
jgi:hypothetical protein